MKDAHTQTHTHTQTPRGVQWAGLPILACGPARQKTGLALPKGAGRARLNETARCAGPLDPLNITFYYF